MKENSLSTLAWIHNGSERTDLPLTATGKKKTTFVPDIQPFSERVLPLAY
jgi:hypothetical protein